MKRITVQEALKLKELPRKLFIHGQEEYLSRQLLKKFLKGKSYEKFYPESLDEFLKGGSGFLFSQDGQSTPVILHAQELPKFLRKKRDKELFLRRLSTSDSFAVVAFLELDYKTLKGELFKGIEELSELVVESKPYTEKQLYGLVDKKFKSAGRPLPKELVKLIVETVGSELTELKHETDKLLCYPGELTREVVEGLLFSSGKVNPFELIFPLLRGDGRELLTLFNSYLEKGGEPLQLLGLLQSQLRNLIEIKC
jgi:DNA polymerase-3 subunit delta